jgi:hypothetical protein
MDHPLAALTDQFLKERRYLKNVTEAALIWYRVAFSNYTSLIAADATRLDCIARGRTALAVKRRR